MRVIEEWSGKRHTRQAEGTGCRIEGEESTDNNIIESICYVVHYV